jgi:uncharacterized membrane protein
MRWRRELPVPQVAARRFFHCAARYWCRDRILHVARADFLFTVTAVLLQPVSGFLLISKLGYSWTQPWIHWSLLLYMLVGCCWLPAVWLQVQMRNLARRASAECCQLPEIYHRYFRYWFALGWPAFAGVLAVFWLMVAKPT